MNKFSQQIHQKFISGQLNGAVYEYMLKIALSANDEDVDLFDGHVKNLAELEIQSIADCERYFAIYASLPLYSAKPIRSGEVMDELLKYAFMNRSRYDLTRSYNYSMLVLDFIGENKELFKTSHPNNAGIEGSMTPDPPFNLDKWIETMRYIYEVANTNNSPLDSVTKQVIAKWDDNEKDHFQRWMKYYQEGNYDKYNVKTAQIYSTRQEPKTPDVKDMFQPPAMPKADPAAEKKQRLTEARNKLRSRLKSVEELLELYRDVLPQDVSTIMRRDVFDLKEKILGLELKASLVDSIMRTSNQFTKHGFIEGANELKKIAQEVAENKLPAVAPQETKQAPVEEAKVPKLVEDQAMKAPNIPPVDATKSNVDVPNFNDVSYREAIKKLEEINSVISERAVVRALAGADIILASLGVASYFTELSEVQAKLMDAFNYSGTRISNVISQLRGRSLTDVKQEHKEEEREEAKKQKQQDAVEVEEELAKPVGEVVSGGPGEVSQAPKA